MPSIFITIPSYEDELLEKTIESAINNARYPTELTFAIALQYKKHPIPNLSRFDSQCHVVSYDVDTRPGVNLIRADLLEFYGGQDYFLMIDSHTNFAKNWDQDLIREIHELGDKAIISKQVTSKVGDVSMHGNLMGEKTLWVLDTTLPGGVSGMVRGYPQPNKYKTRIEKTHYASFHFFFTYGAFVKEVGISKINNHYSEEPLLSYQAFLHGWDIYSIIPYNHIGHNDAEYNLSVYEKESLDEVKTWGIQKDSEDVLRDLNLFFLNHSLGQFSIPEAKRTTKEFYEAIGISLTQIEHLHTLHQKQN
jgi:hypothetical protein